MRTPNRFDGASSKLTRIIQQAGQTLVHIVAGSGHLEVLEVLTQQMGAKADERDVKVRCSSYRNMLRIRFVVF